METLASTRRSGGEGPLCANAEPQTPPHSELLTGKVKRGDPPARSIRNLLRGLARTFKEHVMPVWVLVDMLAGPWVVMDLIGRYKDSFAIQLRRIAEFVVSLGWWRQS